MSAPLSPSADEARRLLEHELAKPDYQSSQPGPLDRLASAFWNWVASIHFGNVSGVPALALTVLLVLAAAAVVVLLLVYGRPRLNRRSAPPVALFGADDDRRTSTLRASAAAAAASGDYTTAIAETFRAIARSLDERGVLTTSPGTTAHAFAGRAAALFPTHSSAVLDAGRSFDEVRYLDRKGSEAAFRAVTELDAALERSAAPVPA